MSQPKGLIKVLLDEYCEFGDRDDAAMDLELFKTAESEIALIKVILKPSTDEGLIESIKDSLSQVMPESQSSKYNWQLNARDFVSRHEDLLSIRLVQLGGS